MKKYFFILLIGLSVISVGCQKKEALQNIQDAVPVKVSRVVLKDLLETADYVGTLKAIDEVAVYPKVNGKIVRKVKEDGALVKKGDVIAYIDRDEVGLTFEEAPIESPIDGVVGRVFVDRGEKVTPQRAVALVVSTGRVKIDLSIPEKYLPHVSIGQEARITVDAYPALEFMGKVTKVSPVVDESTRSAPLEIIIENEKEELKSGMFARVQLVLKRHVGVPVILKEAVIGRGEDAAVYVIKDTVAKLKKVTLGIRQGAFYEITGGLQEGDLVVIIGKQQLYEGARVNAELEKE